MTDNLRDRIAAVLYDRALSRARMSWQWADLKSEEARSRWLADADAVIAELRLREEALDGAVVTDGFGTPIRIRPPRHRYVTDWSNDD